MKVIRYTYSLLVNFHSLEVFFIWDTETIKNWKLFNRFTSTHQQQSIIRLYLYKGRVVLNCKAPSYCEPKVWRDYCNELLRARGIRGTIAGLRCHETDWIWTIDHCWEGGEGTSSVGPDMRWYSSIFNLVLLTITRYGLIYVIWHILVWFGISWYGMGLVRCSMIWYGNVEPGLQDRLLGSQTKNHCSWQSDHFEKNISCQQQTVLQANFFCIK